MSLLEYAINHPEHFSLQKLADNSVNSAYMYIHKQTKNERIFLTGEIIFPSFTITYAVFFVFLLPLQK